MAAGDPIYSSNIVSGVLIPQEGAGFTETEQGLDTGERIYLTHPATPRSAWPKRGDVDAVNPKMWVSDVKDRLLECGLIQLNVGYKGVLRYTGTTVLKGHHIKPGLDTSSFKLPSLDAPDGNRREVVAPVPVPTLLRTFCSLIEPDYDGCGLPAGGAFLPPPPAWIISYYPNPEEPVTVNYWTGWILQSREWPNYIPGQVWEVIERYVYYYNIAV